MKTQLIKIKDEIKLSDEAVSSIVMAVFMSKGECGIFQQKIDEKYRPAFEKIVGQFFEKYKNYIDKACRDRYYYLNNEIDDCRQFIYMNLYKSHEKKYSYTNWDRVVRAIIKRKAIDFSKSVNSSKNGIINETDYAVSVNGEENVNLHETNIYRDDTFINSLNDAGDVKEILLELRAEILETEGFCKRDVDLIDEIIRSYDDGILDIDKILQRAGYKKSECEFVFSVFTNKVSKYINTKCFR